jgi:lysophospholipase L1-like esterase
MRARSAAALLLMLSAAAAAQPQAALDEWPALLLVGDSTLAPQTGYGDALCKRARPGLACLNLGRGGRSTLSYRAEGLWDRVLARLRASTLRSGHVVLIQFGHNDQPGKPGRSTELATTYPANLEQYVADVRAAGGTPVLATPLTRRSFRDGQLHNDLQPWADAMAAVAQRLQVPLLDLHAASRRVVQALGPQAADTLAQGAPGSPAFDRTHVGARGACVFAALLAGELVRQLPALAPQLAAGPDCEAITPPAAVAPAARLNRATFDHPGWAVGTMGGRGGRVERVTTLAASGPGSLRAALEAGGPRQIVFEVGGVIDLEGRSIALRQPFVTVAGQTAPSPGITLIRGGLDVATHDVIVQHLRVRPGAWGRAPRSGGDHDGLSTQGGAHHVIVDHCSFSWATDENLSISGPRFGGGNDPAAWRRHASHTITYSHNLVYEGLAHAVHAKGEHSKGTLVHDNSTGVLLLGNLYASNRERNALFKGGVHAAMVNNLIVNPGTRAVHYNLVAHEWQGHAHQTGRLALVGNVLRHGPDTRPGTPLFMLGGAGDVELHLADNLALDAFGQAVPAVGRYTSGAARVLDAVVPALPPRLPVLPASQLEDSIVSVAGARPWDRDEADLLLLSDVAEGRGQIIDSETQSSGYPRHVPSRRPFDTAAWRRDDWRPVAGWDSLFRPLQTPLR